MLYFKSKYCEVSLEVEDFQMQNENIVNYHLRLKTFQMQNEELYTKPVVD